MVDDLTLASTVALPAGPWKTVAEYLCERFAHVAPSIWQERFERGRVRDATGAVLSAHSPFRAGLVVRYWRELGHEPPIGGVEEVLYQDAEILVADKPPLLPVAPVGAWVEETLLRRLQRRLGLPGLAPMHRLDRATSGLVLFSANPANRGAYHALFRERAVLKTYHALAAPLPGRSFPLTYRSRLVRGEPFFRVREADGEPNTETCIDVIGRGADSWLYELRPRTGHTHQLRVHMAALGAPIAGDDYYPTLAADEGSPDRPPLALLARRLEFTDPVTGERRDFTSRRTLEWPAARAVAATAASGISMQIQEKS